jgi:hypothetical protein
MNMSADSESNLMTLSVCTLGILFLNLILFWNYYDVIGLEIY